MKSSIGQFILRKLLKLLKCKKLFNVMRCLVGGDWEADRRAIKSLHTGLSEPHWIMIMDIVW